MPLSLQKTSPIRAALICTLMAFALYLFTLAPTFGWGDSADLAMRMIDSHDPTFIGSSRDYVLYRAIGSLFQHIPFGDVGTRANLMTAFFGAITVGLIAFLSYYLTGRIVAAYAAAISLTVSHTFWLMSVIAEVYTFNAALIFACYIGMAVWWRSEKIAPLFAATCFAGLALTHHASGLVLCATLVPLILMRVRRIALWHIIALLLVFAAASFPYWQIVSTRLMAEPSLLKALGIQNPSNPFFDTAPAHELMKFIAYALYNFVGLAALLATLGLVTIWQKRCWEMLPAMLWLLLMVLAGITSSIPDKFNIYVLVYPVLAIAIGLGAARIEARWLRPTPRIALMLALLALTPPLAYITTIHAIQRLGVDIVGARHAPYRDNAWYFMWPAKRGDTGPRRYAEEALAVLDKNAVLIADYTLWRPIYFLQQLEGARPDVRTVWVEPLTWRGSVVDYLQTLPCKTPVYLATDTPPEYYQLADIKKHYTLTQTGVVFKVNRHCGR